MPFKRSDRVKELLRHEISLLVQSIKDPRIGFVTITGVDLSDDLMDAKIYFSVLGSDEDRELSSSILENSVPQFRHILGRKLESLYKVPALHFRYDDTPEKAQRVLSILNQISEEKKGEESSAPKKVSVPSASKKSRSPRKKKK